MDLKFFSTMLLAVGASCALPCAIVEPVNSKGNARITSENAIILWNSKGKTETLIRRAEFSSEGKKLGFLVPTPTAPRLYEVGDQLQKDLANAIDPIETQVQTGLKFTLLSPTVTKSSNATPDASAGSQSKVAIVSTQNVTSYKAVVLAATDSKALADWLQSNGFAMRPALQDWLDLYVKKGWTITAFKFENGRTQTLLSSPNIAIEFHTPAPVYPYREPADTAETPGRSLRIYFASDESYSARLETGPWKIKPEFSFYSSFDPARFGIPRATNYQVLTTFFDPSPTRKGLSDLKFSPDPGHPYVAPVPKIIFRDHRKPVSALTWFPVAVLLLFSLSSGIMWFRRLWHADDELDGNITE